MIILADAGLHTHLQPLTLTRPVGMLRPGILTIGESWARMTEMPVGYRTETHLQPKYPLHADQAIIEVVGGLLPTPDVVSAVLDLEPGQVLLHGQRVLAFHGEGQGGPSLPD